MATYSGPNLRNVKSIGNTPPVTPVTGAWYIVDSAPTGAWAGQANKLARWNGSSYDFITPFSRYLLWDDATNTLRLYDETVPGWVIPNATNSGGSGANTSLSNLASVAINTSLLPTTAGTIDLGSSTKPWQFFYISGSSASPASNNFKIVGSATGARVITLPDASDTLVGKATTDTLTNKTLTSPVISNIVNGGTLTLPTSTDTIVGRNTTDTLTNKTLVSSTNVLGGVTLTLGSDATGDIYYRNSSGILTRLGIGGTNQVLTVSGGLPSWQTIAGSGAATIALDNLSSVAINTSLLPATAGSIDLGSGGKPWEFLFLSGNSLTPATNNFKITGTATAARVITLPDATDTIVGRTTTDTLTNKTLTSPVISSIVNGGTLTLPTVTDTLVARTSTDTLTNKTLTSSTNTLGGVTMTLGSDATGDIYYRNSSGILTRLGVGSTNQVLTISGGLPTWATVSGTGAATVALDNLSSVAVNTSLLPGSAGTIDLGSGTKPWEFLFLSGNSLTPGTNNFKITGTATASRVITLPDTTDTLVGKNTTDTLANKTLTSPVIATIVNSGTLTLPSSTDTLIGRATTDTLTNKTLTSSTNVIGNVTLTLGSDATGDIYYRNSSGILTRLGIGSTNQVLTVSGGLPSWATLAGAGAATVALDNLSSVAINVSLLPATAGAIDLGNSTKPWEFLFLSGTSITPASNNFKITGVATAARVITLPDASDTLVGKATTDTLTNKTLTSPVISTIVNVGTLTLPSSTDTLVARTTTDTLTNKTLTSSTNILGGVTLTLGSDATGDVYYRNSSGILTRLGIGTSNQVLTVSGGLPSWQTISGAGAATVALDNLASVAINASLIAGTAGTLDLGSLTKPWQFLYFSGASLTPASNNFKITGTATGARTITFQDSSYTVIGNNTTDTLTNKTLTSSTNILGGVTMTLGSDGTGDVYYRNSIGVLTRLAIGSTNQVLTVSGGLPSWQSVSGAGGATVALDNLASVAINLSLVPATAAGIDIGSTTKPWQFLYFAGTSVTPASNNFKITGVATGARTITFQDSTHTVVGRDTTDTLTNKTITSNNNTLGGVSMSLGSDATGDIYYRNSLGVLTRLGIGTTGQVLTVASGLPSWATGGGGGGVTGTGTTNRMALWTSSSAIGASGKVREANSKVGIHYTSDPATASAGSNSADFGIGDFSTSGGGTLNYGNWNSTGNSIPFVVHPLVATNGGSSMVAPFPVAVFGLSGVAGQSYATTAAIAMNRYSTGTNQSNGRLTIQINNGSNDYPVDTMSFYGTGRAGINNGSTSTSGNDAQARFHVGNQLINAGSSFSTSSWNSQGLVPLMAVWDDQDAASAQTHPALILAKKGVAAGQEAQRAEFGIGRYESVSNAPRTRLDIRLAHATNESKGVRIASFMSYGGLGLAPTNGVDPTANNPDAILQIGDTPGNNGSFSVSSWNSSGNRLRAFFVTPTSNGGSSIASSEPALVLSRNGVIFQSYSNYIEFKVARWENNSTNARSALTIAATHGAGDAVGTDIAEFRSDKSVIFKGEYGGPQTTGSGGSVTIDWSLTNQYEHTATSNTTFTFSNAKAGHHYILLFKENGTGGFSWTFPASVKWPGGSTPTFSTTANSVNTAMFYFDGTNFYILSYQTNM